MARLASAVGPKTLLHPSFIGAGATLLIAALVTDFMYWHTSNWQCVAILVLLASFNGWKVTMVRTPATGDRP